MTHDGAWRFDAIGTRWEIATSASLTADTREAVTVLIDRFDSTWSRFRADSHVARLAAHGGRMPGDSDGAEMLDLYAAVSDATGGAVNPLVGDALARRGYDAQYRLEDLGAEPAVAQWRGILHWTAAEVILDVPATLDVGACGKGRLVDLVAELLAARTAGPVVVDASGDIAVRGQTERIGLEHPYDPSRAIGVWEVTDAALCASATTRRAWGDGLHHVLDARTGEPVRTIAATWAVAETAMLADATATALFFDGGARFAHDHDVAWVRMTTDGRIERSPGCSAHLFTSRDSVET